MVKIILLNFLIFSACKNTQKKPLCKMLSLKKIPVHSKGIMKNIF